MFTIQKIKLIEDEKVRDRVLEVIETKEEFYRSIFEHEKSIPRMTIRFENLSPFRLMIIFQPAGEKPVKINIEGYKDPEVVTRYAFQKLRRTAKNYVSKKRILHRRSR